MDTIAYCYYYIDWMIFWVLLGFRPLDSFVILSSFGLGSAFRRCLFSSPLLSGYKRGASALISYVCYLYHECLSYSTCPFAPLSAGTSLMDTSYINMDSPSESSPSSDPFYVVKE